MILLLFFDKFAMIKNYDFFTRFRSLDTKFYAADSESDGLVLLRQIGSSKKRTLILQERRPHLLVESAEATDAKVNVCTHLYIRNSVNVRNDFGLRSLLAGWCLYSETVGLPSRT